MTLDGLTEEQFEDQYRRALYLRKFGGSVRNPEEMQSLILDIMSDPMITLRDHYQAAIKDEETREFWDLGDWLKFIHEFSYKPDWALAVAPEYHFNQLTFVLWLNVLTDIPIPDNLSLIPKRKNRLSTTFRVIAEHVHNEKYALHIVENMIRQAEDEITEIWFQRNGAPVRQAK